jgi:hypothetical protein
MEDVTLPFDVFIPTIRHPLESFAVEPAWMRTPKNPGTSTSRGRYPPHQA